MSQAKQLGGSAFRNSRADLMARIADRSGAAVGPADIVSIRYSIHERPVARSDCPAAVADHDAVSLQVGNVIFAPLQTRGRWSVDEVGYNFRHEIRFRPTATFPKARSEYQVRYELVLATGETALLQFPLRLNPI